MLNFTFYLTIGLFIFVCLFLILIVLIQKGRGGGLASAFGGAGGNTAFGSKTGDVLTWATSVIFGIFIFLAVALNLISNYRAKQTSTLSQSAAPMGVPQQQSMPAVPKPAQEPAPAPVK